MISDRLNRGGALMVIVGLSLALWGLIWAMMELVRAL